MNLPWPLDVSDILTLTLDDAPAFARPRRPRLVFRPSRAASAGTNGKDYQFNITTGLLSAIFASSLSSRYQSTGSSLTRIAGHLGGPPAVCQLRVMRPAVRDRCGGRPSSTPTFSKSNSKFAFPLNPRLWESDPRDQQLSHWPRPGLIGTGHSRLRPARHTGGDSGEGII